MVIRALTASSGGGIQHYTETTTYGNKTITCGFRPKVILVTCAGSDEMYGCIYAEENAKGYPAEKVIHSTSDWLAVTTNSGDNGYACIGQITDTGFVMRTQNGRACRIDAWG